MTTIAWTLTAILALAFFGAAALKTLLAKPALREKGLLWVDDFSSAGVKGIGLVEFLGACGLIVPWVFHTFRILTPLAAIGLAVVMVGATIVHVRRGESTMAVPPLVLAIMSAGLAVIRFRQL